MTEWIRRIALTGFLALAAWATALCWIGSPVKATSIAYFLAAQVWAVLYLMFVARRKNDLLKRLDAPERTKSFVTLAISVLTWAAAYTVSVSGAFVVISILEDRELNGSVGLLVLLFIWLWYGGFSDAENVQASWSRRR